MSARAWRARRPGPKCDEARDARWKAYVDRFILRCGFYPLTRKQRRAARS